MKCNGNRLRCRRHNFWEMEKRGAGIKDVIGKPPGWASGFPGEKHMRTLGGYTYNFCGPGTNVQKRMARGDIGISALDNICKQHDISYSTARRGKDIRKADREFIRQVNKLPKTPATVMAKTAIRAKVGLEKGGFTNKGTFTTPSYMEPNPPPPVKKAKKSVTWGALPKLATVSKKPPVDPIMRLRKKFAPFQGSS